MDSLNCLKLKYIYIFDMNRKIILQALNVYWEKVAD